MDLSSSTWVTVQSFHGLIKPCTWSPSTSTAALSKNLKFDHFTSRSQLNYQELKVFISIRDCIELKLSKKNAKKNVATLK